MNDTENKDLNGNADDRDNNVNGNIDNDSNHVNKNAGDGTQDERFEPTPGMDFREFDDNAASESFSESHNDTVTADSGKNGSCVDEDNVEAEYKLMPACAPQTFRRPTACRWVLVNSHQSGNHARKS